MNHINYILYLIVRFSNMVWNPSDEKVVFVAKMIEVVKRQETTKSYRKKMYFPVLSFSAVVLLAQIVFP